MINNKILLLILVLPLLLGFSFESVDLKFNGNSVEYISQDHPPMSAFLIVSFEGDYEVRASDVSSVFLYGSLSLPNCDTEDDVTTCRSSMAPLRINLENPEIEFEITNETHTETLRHTLGISFYNAEPEVESITINGCEEDCFVTPELLTPVEVVFRGSTVGFDNSRVAIATPGVNPRGGVCQGSTCQFYIRPDCVSGNVQRITLPSFFNGLRTNMDDAGNLVDLNFEKEYTCDDEPPVIESVEFYAEDGTDIIAINDRFYARINVTEEWSNRLNITIDTTSLGGGTANTICTSSDQHFSCPVQLRASVTRSGDYELPITVTDAAGNQDSNTSSVFIYGTDDTRPDFWSNPSLTLSSNYINTDNLIFSREIFSTLKLEGPSDVSLLDAKLGSCKPQDENSGRDGMISNFRVLTVDQDTIYFKFTMRQAGRGDTNIYADFLAGGAHSSGRIIFDCEAELYSRDQSTIYRIPEKENFTVRINLERGEHLGNKIQEEIEHSERRVSNWASLATTIDILELTAGKLCESARAANTAAAGLSTATAGVSFAAQVYTPLEPTAQTMSAGASRTVEFTERYSGFVNTLCRAYSCQPPGPVAAVLGAPDDLLDNIPGGNYVTETFGMDSMMSAMNPYNSELVAMAFSCMPAIRHHITERMSIECSYQECLSAGVGLMGQSVSTCREQKSYSHCVRNTDSITKALPPVAFLDEVNNRLNMLANDPIAAGTFLTTQLCGVLGSFSSIQGIVYYPCATLAKIQKAGEFKNDLDHIMQFASFNIGGVGMRPPNCESIEEFIDPDSKFWVYGQQEALEDIQDPNTMSGNLYPTTHGTWLHDQGFSVVERRDGRGFVYTDARPALDADGRLDPDRIGYIGIYVGDGTNAARYVGTASSIADRYGVDRGDGTDQRGDRNVEASSEINWLDFDKFAEGLQNREEGGLGGFSLLEGDYDEDGNFVIDSSVPSDFILPPEAFRQGLYGALVSERADRTYKNNLIDIMGHDRGVRYYNAQNKYESQRRNDMDEFDRLVNEYNEVDARSLALQNEYRDFEEGPRGVNRIAKQRLESRIEQEHAERNRILERFAELGIDYEDVRTGRVTREDAVSEETKEAREEMEDILKDYRREATWNQFYGGYGATMRSAWNNAFVVSNMRNIFGIQLWRERMWVPDWAEDLMRSFDNFLDHVTLNTYCEKSRLGNVDSSSGFVGISDGISGVQAGAHINARGARHLEDDYNYMYWVSGGVKAQDLSVCEDDEFVGGVRLSSSVGPDVDLNVDFSDWCSDGNLISITFRVIMRGSGVPDTDVTNDLFDVGVVVLEPGKVFPFSGSQTRVLKSEYEFDTVCIDFGLDEDELRVYYDVIRGLDDGMLCSSVKFERTGVRR